MKPRSSGLNSFLFVLLLLLSIAGIVVAMLHLLDVTASVAYLRSIGPWLFFGRILLLMVAFVCWRRLIQSLYIWRVLTMPEAVTLAENRYRTVIIGTLLVVDTALQILYWTQG